MLWVEKGNSNFVFVNQYISSRKTEKNALAILLNIFADALETLLQGAAENVMLEVSVIQDWIFLLCIPWVKRLGQFIPECTAVKELNSLTESEIPCGKNKFTRTGY